MDVYESTVHHIVEVTRIHSILAHQQFYSDM